MRYILLCVLSVLILFSACRKDEQINTDSNVNLRFSRDTVIFDTVFTTVGTATQVLKVFNPDNQAVEISSIYLGEGQASNFRINVDGETGSSHSDVFLPANDSIYLFVDVTIDPNMADGVFIEQDSILFVTNGNEQHVDLIAWGQDALFYYPTDDISGLPALTCLDGMCVQDPPPAPVTVTWTADRPVVIYGYLIIDEGDKLIIEEGTQIYFHEGSGLWVWEDGQITVNGSAANPVVFQHDRPEVDYDNIPGQWDLIRINEGPAGMDNVFNHAIIKNSIIGIEAKPLTLQTEDIDKPTSENKLILNSCIIQQNTAIGLLARKYRIEATNCLFANAGLNTCGISGGGAYDFNFCSFTNYWVWSNRTEPSFYMSDLYVDEAGNPNQADIESFQATNCIMYGNVFEDFLVELGPSQTTSDIFFDRCLVKVDEMDVSDATIYSNFLVNEPLGGGFVAPSENDFHLLDYSPAIDGGQAGFCCDDIEGPFRIDGLPDLGCYEFRP